jgi:pyridoxal phosphate enzyme (YggS family)
LKLAKFREMDIKRNIESIIAQLSGTQARLVAVSKTQPLEKIREAYDAGHRMFGENRVQEMVTKHAALPADIEWHLIGHLQTNKVKQIVPFVSLIHSVDSEKLLAEIDKQGAKASRVVPCLLQVHIAREETKFGFGPEELEAFVGSGRILKYANAAIVGLMGMATLTDDREKVREEFRGLRVLFDKLKASRAQGLEMKELSMGMSSDFEVAVQEGSTLVRIGTSIFGTRITKPEQP